MKVPILTFPISNHASGTSLSLVSCAKIRDADARKRDPDIAKLNNAPAVSRCTVLAPFSAYAFFGSSFIELNQSDDPKATLGKFVDKKLVSSTKAGERKKKHAR